MESVIEASPWKVGVIEFGERIKMSIIDGKEYEDELETIKQAKDVQKMKKDTLDVIDRYDDDSVALTTDVILGKPDLKAIVPGIIMKRVEQKNEENVRVQLSILKSTMNKKPIKKSCPIQIQSNGRLTLVLISNEDFIRSVINNFDTIIPHPLGNSEELKIPICLAVKFKFLGKVDPRFHSNLRAELTRINEKLPKAAEDKCILTPVPGMESKRML